MKNQRFRSFAVFICIVTIVMFEIFVDIIFFGEGLPNVFYEKLDTDKLEVNFSCISFDLF